MLKTFPKGVHVNPNKITRDVDIEVMPAPKLLYVPMVQHSGAPSQPTVKIGDEVVKGQLIGSADGKNGLNVFSPCCGVVKAIEERFTDRDKCKHIVIENNFKNDNAHLPAIIKPTAEEIVKRVAYAGIAGMAGGGFPTALKLSVKGRIKTLIINGAECEPYSTCDYRIMKEYTQKFIEGALLLKQALNADKVVIGIEEHNSDAAAHLNDYIIVSKLKEIYAEVVESKYPQGSDRQLIYALTRLKIPKNKRSSSQGVVVFNVHTAFSTYLAVKEGIPCYSRVVTVTGEGIKTPKNLFVPTGTPYLDLINHCGGINEGGFVKLICGGPMMGTSVADCNTAVTKLCGCLLLLSGDEACNMPPSACISCARCVKSCPMNLMPLYIHSHISAHIKEGLVTDMEKFGLEHCIECGCCAYVCPAKIPLVQSIRLAKEKVNNAKEKINKGGKA